MTAQVGDDGVACLFVGIGGKHSVLVELHHLPRTDQELQDRLTASVCRELSAARRRQGSRRQGGTHRFRRVREVSRQCGRVPRRADQRCRAPKAALNEGGKHCIAHGGGGAAGEGGRRRHHGVQRGNRNPGPLRMSAEVGLDYLLGMCDAGGKPRRISGEPVERPQPALNCEVVRSAFQPGKAGRHQPGKFHHRHHAVRRRARPQDRRDL